MFCKCSFTVRTSTSNNSAINAWLSQIVSSWKRHSTRARPSSVTYSRNSPAGTNSSLMSDELVPAGEFLLYVTEDGRARVECRFQDETIWLSQALIAELFDVDVRTVNEHLQNIYGEG